MKSNSLYREELFKKFFNENMTISQFSQLCKTTFASTLRWIHRNHPEVDTNKYFMRDKTTIPDAFKSWDPFHQSGSDLAKLAKVNAKNARNWLKLHYPMIRLDSFKPLKVSMKYMASMYDQFWKSNTNLAAFSNICKMSLVSTTKWMEEHHSSELNEKVYELEVK